MTVTTYFSQSAGKHLVIKDIPYPQLVNTINAVARRLGGGTDETLDALRAELASRPPPDPNAPAPAPRRAVAAPTAAHTLPPAGMGHNRAPDDEPLKLRLEEDYSGLLTTASNLEIQAGKLPKEIASDDDVAEVNAWIVLAQNVGRDAERERKVEKDPFLKAGKLVDEFFGSIGAGLKKRIDSLEQRKIPYLRAKRAREEAERAQRAAELRRAEEEARERQERERKAAEDARQAAAAAEQALRSAQTPEELDAAEAATRAAAKEQELAEEAVVQAGKDAKAAGKVADREEKILAGDHRHVLGKVSAGGASSAVSTVWTPDIHNRARLLASLGPLAPFIAEGDLEKALQRAAKADPRPAVPGVDWVEDFKSQTRASRA